MSDPEITWEELRAGIQKMEEAHGFVPTVSLPSAVADVASMQHSSPEGIKKADDLQMSFRIQRGPHEIVEADQVSQTGFLKVLEIMNMGTASGSAPIPQRPPFYMGNMPTYGPLTYTPGYASENVHGIPEVAELATSQAAPQKLNPEELRKLAASAAGVVANFTSTKEVDVFMERLHDESPEIIAPLMLVLKNNLEAAKLASVNTNHELPTKDKNHESTKKRGGVKPAKRILIGMLAFSLSTGVVTYGVRKVTSEKIVEECVAAKDIDLGRTGICALSSGLQDRIKGFIR